MTEEKFQKLNIQDILAKMNITEEDRVIFDKMGEETVDALRKETEE